MCCTATGNWKKIRMTFPGELEDYSKIEMSDLFKRRLGTVYSGGRLGTFVPVSNPVTQRLTVFSEDASVLKKNISFFSAGCAVSSINGRKNGLIRTKKRRTNCWFAHC